MKATTCASSTLFSSHSHEAVCICHPTRKSVSWKRRAGDWSAQWDLPWPHWMCVSEWRLRNDFSEYTRQLAGNLKFLPPYIPYSGVKALCANNWLIVLTHKVKSSKVSKGKTIPLVSALPHPARCDKASISADHLSITELLTVLRMPFSPLCLPFSPAVKIWLFPIGKILKPAARSLWETHYGCHYMVFDLQERQRIAENIWTCALVIRASLLHVIKKQVRLALLFSSVEIQKTKPTIVWINAPSFVL